MGVSPSFSSPLFLDKGEGPGVRVSVKGPLKSPWVRYNAGPIFEDLQGDCYN